ncbi:MAG TPA: tetratricopeptide repeat protein [Gammaproteobacteria bacterium]|jgi:hypothetical protein|nr:tetratricopeptide repeat protein [Gammaproteobacteria bacterium]
MKARINRLSIAMLWAGTLLMASLLLSGCSSYGGVAPADDQDQPIASAPGDTAEVIQARGVLKEEVEKTPLVRHMDFDVKPGDLRVITYTDPSTNTQDLVELVLVLPNSISISYIPGGAFEYPGWKLTYTEYQDMKQYYWLSSSWSETDAQAAADALRILVLDARQDYARGNALHFEKFRLDCQSFNALKDKPPMSDEAQQHQATAESDYAKGDLDDAGDEYQAALKLYPCWPEGLLKRANILGATGWYAPAVDSMQRYLELVPDAADAQALRNQIAVWQSKMGG